MKKLIVLGAYASLLLLLANCGPHIGKIVTSYPVPTKEQAQTEFTSEQLAEGRKIWQSTCDRCHDLHPETKHTPEGWNKTLRRMIHKSKLTEEEGILVRAYLIANSK